MILRCCCCGGNAPAVKHWFNRDQGYGICPRCFLEDLAKVGPDLARDYYGLAGVHHSIPQTDHAHCDGAGPHVGEQVRVLPEGGTSNSILCHACYLESIDFRKERNRTLDGASTFDLPSWASLKVYEYWEQEQTK